MKLIDYLDWRASANESSREAEVRALVEAAGVSRETIMACAHERRPVRNIDVARKLSLATGGAVSVEDLCW